MKRLFALPLTVVALASLSLSAWAQESTFSERPVTVITGDTNGDLELDLSDAVHLFSHFFLGGPAPADLVRCSDVPNASVDVNGDGNANLSDGIYLLSYLYLGGEELRDGCRAGLAAGAFVVHSSEVITAFPPPQPNICNGDIVSLSGQATTVSHTVVAPNGNMNTTSVISWHALRGTGLVTGDEYIGVGQAILVFTNTAGATTTLDATMRFITPGGAGDHHAVARLHITTNANGEITTNITSISFECRS